jgi:hypothetical protein
LTGNYPIKDGLRGMFIVWVSSMFCVHFAYAK